LRHDVGHAARIDQARRLDEDPEVEAVEDFGRGANKEWSTPVTYRWCQETLKKDVR